MWVCFFFQAEDGIRDATVTGVQTCALPISAQRVRAAGFQSRGVVGENVAAGAVNADEVVRGWLASPEHCENLMDGRFSQMGVAYAVNLESSSAIYWTQLLASSR